MHHLLLHCGIYLVILFCEIIARPIMFHNTIGVGLVARDDNDIRTDFKLGSTVTFGGRNRNVKTAEHNTADTNVYLKEHSNRNAVIANLSMTPEYMLELYKNVSESSPDLHNSNIVRSFKNNPDLAGNSTDTTYILSNHRVHSLGFDISALDLSESINSAELRLYTLIKSDQRSYSGVSRIVSIYQSIDVGGHRSEPAKYNFICSKFVHTMENAWESFDVTKALTLSVQQGLRIERLQVRIESLMFHSPQSDMDINATPNDVKQPLLVVYSNDKSKLHEESVEKYELLMHELSLGAGAFASTQRGHVDNVYDYNSQEVVHARHKRSNGHNLCKRRPMYVSFADLEWDWIIAPKGYQAYQCAGKCPFPMGAHFSPTKHAIVQSLMHEVHPKRAVRSCCVPTKLEPISLLYLDKHGVVTYKYKYDQMVVAECGCR